MKLIYLASRPVSVVADAMPVPRASHLDRMVYVFLSLAIYFFLRYLQHLVQRLRSLSNRKWSQQDGGYHTQQILAIGLWRSGVSDLVQEG